jgi:hypothetical protein
MSDKNGTFINIILFFITMIKRKNMETLICGSFWNNTFQNTEPISDTTIEEINAQYWTTGNSESAYMSNNIFEFRQTKRIAYESTKRYSNAK